MAYWTLTESCLITLKQNWIKYYNDRIEALKYLSTRAEEDYRDEGNTDLRRGRYTARSVQEWYDDKVYKLKKWVRESIEELDRQDAQFERLWKTACSDFYDSRDYGYIIIYDFYRFEKRKEYSSEVTPGHFRVRFSGQSWWYTCCDRRRDLEFYAGKPEFDRHD